MKRKFWVVLLLVFAGYLRAQPPPTSTQYIGTVKDLTGATVTSGRITWQLNAPQGGVIPGTGSFVSTTVSCGIDANGHPVSTTDGTSPCLITNNSALTPTGTSYTMCTQPQFVSPGSCIVTFAPGGTVDISTVVPVPTTGPFNYAGTPGPPGPMATPAGDEGQVQVKKYGTWGVVPPLSYDFTTDTLHTINLNVSGTSNLTVPPAQVTWPPSCSSGTYVPSSNSCVPTGTAANPGGTAGQSQLNAGGTFAGVPGSMSDANYGWITQGGLQYAKGWQSGAGNNGIANAQAPLATVVSDPSYSMTEAPALSVFTATPMHWKDARVSQENDFYRNPGTDASGNPAYANRFGSYGVWGHQITCQYDTSWTAATSGDVRPNCLEITENQLNPGSNGGGLGTGWQTGVAARFVSNSVSGGILETAYIEQNKSGAGDNTAVYCYVHGEGGWTDPSGEENKCFAANIAETTTAYAGKAANTSPLTNPASLVTAPISGYSILSGASVLQGTGRYLINRGACTSYPTGCPALAAPYTGLVTNYAASAVVNTVSAISIDGTVPASNAWGKLNGDCNNSIPGNPPFSRSVTCNINSLTGTLNTTALMCFTGQFHECAVPTAFTGSSITIPLRHMHATGSAFFQGGMAGYGLEQVPSTQKPASQPLPFLIDVFGSTDTHTLQVGFFRAGVGQPIGGSGAPLVFNIGSNLSSQGPLIIGVYVAAGSTLSLAALNAYMGSSIWITGSDAAQLNGLCTNLVMYPNQGNNSTLFNCTHVGQSGNFTNTTGTPTGAGANNGMQSQAYNLWPMAEVLDVRNTSVNPPVVDGTLMLEPNVLGTVNQNDVLEETHHVSAEWQGTTTNLWTYNPYSITRVISATAQGAGFSGGSPTLSSNSFLFFTNSNPDSMYQGAGGVASPPNVMNYSGAYDYGLNLDHLPGNSGAFIQALGKNYQVNDPNFKYYFYQVFNRSNVSYIQHSPYYGDTTMLSGRVLNLTGAPVVINSDLGQQTFRAHVSFAALAAPVLTVTASNTGGTLADGTYYYTVQARGAYGANNYYSQKSNEATCVIATGGANTGSCFLSWTAVAGATAYYPMGRATGAETNFLAITGLGITTFLDTNATTPSGTNVPTSNPGIENAGWLGVQSSGTTTETRIVSAAGAGGNTVTLPSTSGTLLTAGTPGYFQAPQIIGGNYGTVAMGDFYNLVTSSTNILKATTSWTGSNFTDTGGQIDPSGGTTASKLVSTNAGSVIYDNLGYTLAAGQTYCWSSWIRGNAGTETVRITIGDSAVGGFFTVPATWTYYSASGTGATLNHPFGWNTNQIETIFVAFPMLIKGACPSNLPYVPTGATAILDTAPVSGMLTPVIYLNSPQTVVACSTSGTVTYSMPLQGPADKKVLAHMAACVGTASYTFPTAFINLPGIFYSSTAGTSVTSLSTTATTITGTTTTGTVILEDF